jgi:hypothetical protein
MISTKRGGRQSLEKLILLKNNVTSSAIHMLHQIIDTIFEIGNVNTILLESKSTFGIFSDLRNNVSKKQKQDWDSVKIPKFQDSVDTDKCETTVLEHIRNLHLGEFNNVFKAKRHLVGGRILPKNFDKHHLLTVLWNFEHELENMLLLLITLKKIRHLLNIDLTHLECLPQHSQDCEAIYIHVNNKFARIVYDAIALQTEHSDSPSWCTALVALLQFVFRCKE